MIELSQSGNYINTVNKIRSCTTPGCKGNLAPVAVKCRGLGGAITVRYSCDGCNLKDARFEAHSKCETMLAGSNTISVSLQVVFIIAGNTHVTICKTLCHSLGIDTFMCRICAMHSIVESMLDEICDAAKAGNEGYERKCARVVAKYRYSCRRYVAGTAKMPRLQ